MDGKSLTPQEIKLQQLKEILPEAFAEGKVDWEKLKATLGEDINFANERYVLNWAGKSEAFKVLQAPTTKTLVPDKEESVNFDETKHIFIEGENMEVLKILQKSYFGKVKMIYIDPPYNTGKDSFIYPDKFSETKAEYEKRVGDKDEDGYLTKDGMFRKNSKENGQYHSNWLNMMMPRLYLAKNLLRQDGVIFVSIDDNEVDNLRLMMNEVFGEENFVAKFIRKTGIAARLDAKHISIETDYILCYSKNLDILYLNRKEAENLDSYSYSDEFLESRGYYKLNKLDRGSINYSKKMDYPILSPEGLNIYPGGNKESNNWCWRWSNEKIEWGIKNKFIEFKKTKNGWQVYFKQYQFVDNKDKLIKRENPFKNLLIGGFNNEIATKEILDLFENKVFDYPKPVILNKHFAKISTNKDSFDIVLDFFAGSGTTAHAVMDLNKEDGGSRKCISVQLPEITDEKSEAYKAGYKTIADIAKERIRRAGKKIQKEIKEKIKAKEKEIEELESQLDIDGKEEKINKLKTEIEQLKNQDLGFKVLKLSDSNFKQWQQIQGNDAEALEKQMKLFVDPVSENSTTENMVYELLLKSGKDLNSTLRLRSGYYVVNEGELILMLEKATQEIVNKVIAEKPQKVVALDRLFKGNDQLKTNTSLQMKDAEIEFKTI